ncbi:AI-2E family transporter [Enteractinococcus helveticum]|uniref:AI-2E family transporter n=2 Tax=Enteractinococcus helveticum TaxID=1837282 RepID=A0A1B7M1Q4_9MICC|nr:AI-2E family transporter [Enteractinococcus helveticum]
MASTLDELNQSRERRPNFTVSQLWTDTLGRLGMRSLQLLIVGTLVGLVVLALLNLTVVVIPTLIAIILACALWPLVRLCRRVMSNVLAAWTVFLGALLVLGGVGTALVFSVINEWSTLVEQAVEGFNQLREWGEQFLGGLALTIDQSQIDSMVNTVTGFLTSAEFGTGAVTTISAAGTFVTSLVLLLVILFFLLKDGDRIWAFFVSWAPEHFKAQTIASGDRAMHTFGGYIRGTAIVAAVDAIGITIALLILQVPLAIPLGVVVFLGAFIPLVGATVAGILATLVALVANGPVVALIVLAAVILVNQLEGNFLQPVVMAQTLNLHALVILMALTAGTVLAGIIGAVLAVPLVAVAWSVVKVWTGREEVDGLGPVDKAQLQIEAVGKERREHLKELKRQQREEKAAAKAASSSNAENVDADA